MARLWLGATIVGLLTAGSMHLLLVPEHLVLLPLLGSGFLVTGIAQVLVALGLIVFRGGRRLLRIAVLAAGIPLLLYAIDVTAGLPLVGHRAAHEALGDHAHAAGAEHAGALDPAALTSKGAEAGALFAALVLLHSDDRRLSRRRRPPRPSRERDAARAAAER